MKRCKKCNQEKELDEFRKDKSTSDGLSSSCKTCLSLQERQNSYKRKFGNLDGFKEFIEFYDNRGKKSNEVLSNNMKCCRKCGELKFMTDFVKDNRSFNGYSNLCKDCKKIESNEHYNKVKNDPDFHNRKLIANRKYKELNKEKVQIAWTDYNNRPEVKEKNHNRYMEKQSKLTKEDRVKELFKRAKSRAKKYNSLFTITLEDLDVPDICPILKIKLNWDGGPKSDNSPSLDKIVPEIGYVKGNCQIISNLANIMKNKASKEILMSFSENIIEYINNKDIVRPTENVESVELEDKELLG